MKAPFKTPVRLEGKFLVAEDCELICQTEGATKKELRFIVTAINAHAPLVVALSELLACTELNMDDMEDDTRAKLEAARAALAQGGAA